jgi:TATA-box binding protein (TBP) (component of TFIID and TFIIIB)
MKRAWDSLLTNLVERAAPLPRQPREESNLPRIVNVISTAILLPQSSTTSSHRLPLAAIAYRLGPCAQYAPEIFPALIIKLRDSTTTPTALVFASGKIVVVSTLTTNHTRYISQLVRSTIEQVRPPLSDESLVGRTSFSHCAIHNIVGHSDLGCRIDLQSMVDAAPLCCKWIPDSFPGLKCKIWLTSEHACLCNSSVKREVEEEVVKVIGKQPKCVCAVKVLVFDTGRIVITGARSVRDVNSVFFRIHALAPRYESGSVLRDQRFYQRFGTLLVTGGTERLPAHRREMSSSEAIALVVARTHGATRVEGIAAIPNITTTALMRLADAGRFDDVRELVEMDPAQLDEVDSSGRTALRRIKAIPLQERSEEHRKIIEFLVVESKKRNQ